MTHLEETTLAGDPQDVRFVYQLVTQRAFEENRLSSEKTNLFLISNSFLIGGFILSLTVIKGNAIPYALAGVGIILSVLQMLTMQFTAATNRAWIRLLNDIESHSSFDYLRAQHWLPQQSRYEAYKKNRHLQWIVALKLDPWNLVKFWIPFGMIVMWALLIVFSISAILE